jgi:hypothetical protein
MGFLLVVSLPGPGWGVSVPPIQHGPAEGQVPEMIQDPLAIVHVNIVPMEGDSVLTDHTALVRGGRIIGLGPSNSTIIPDGATVIDGSGLLLLPGLTDAHVHLDEEIGARPDFGDASLFLAYGVTTVFNLRGEPQHLDWKKKIQEGAVLAPNLYNAGEFVNEPRVNTAEEAEREVLNQLQSGYDMIKFREVIDFKDWRVLTTTGLEKQAYLRLNETAREVGMPLVGHAPYRVGLTGLLEAGQSLAHMNELANLYFLPPLSLEGEGFMAMARWSLFLLLVYLLLGNAFRLATRLFRRTRKPGSSEWTRALNNVNRLAALAAACLLVWILVVPPGRLFGRGWLLLLLSALSVLFMFELFRLVRDLIRNRAGRRVVRILNVLRLIALAAALGFAVSLVRWVPFSWRGSDWVMNRVAGDLKAAGVWMQSTLVLYETGMGVRDGFRYEQRIADPALLSRPCGRVKGNPARCLHDDEVRPPRNSPGDWRLLSTAPSPYHGRNRRSERPSSSIPPELGTKRVTP